MPTEPFANLDFGGAKGGAATKLLHVSITATSADTLSIFYRRAFGYAEARPARCLSGAAVWRGNGLDGVDLRSIWLSPPDPNGPVLELLEYETGLERPPVAVNERGYAHLAFAVADITLTSSNVLAHGGSMVGEITDLGAADAPCLVVYMRDPEGNVIELEEHSLVSRW